MSPDTVTLVLGFAAAGVCLALAAGLEWQDYRRRNRIGLHPNRDKNEQGEGS